MEEVKKPVKGAVRRAHKKYSEITRRKPVSPELREILSRKEKPAKPEPKDKRSARPNRDMELP